MLVDKNPFPLGSNYIKPTNKFNLDVNLVCYYEYEDPFDAPFFLEAYPLEGETNAKLTKRLEVKGKVLKCAHYVKTIMME